MNPAEFQRQWWLTGLSIAGFTAVAIAPGAAQDMQWLRLNGLPQVSMGVDVEGSTEELRMNSGNSTYEHLSVSPLVGLRSSGSIYHPNLLAFDLSGELGWGWDSQTIATDTVNRKRDDSTELMRYLAQLAVLENRNYNATAYAAKDHTYRDYGSFSTYKVDANRYGGTVNWQERAFTLNANLGYRDETDSGLAGTSEITETLFNLYGSQQRSFGQTSLSFHANDMENAVDYGGTHKSTGWSVGVSDAETLGRRRNINWGNGLTYGQSKFSGLQLNTLNFTDNLSVNHTPKLGSYLNFNFNRSELRTQTISDRYQGSAGVHHQLYESLASNLEAHGSHQEDQTAVGDSTFEQYGISLNENYTKKLQSWGRLSIGAGVSLDHQDQDSGGGIITTTDEGHTIYQLSSPSYQLVYLNRPKVLSVIMVRSGSYSVPASDYDVFTYGELTEIRLKPIVSASTAALITGGSLAVTVTYTSDSLNNAAYETIAGNVSVRLDLWDSFGVYGRFNWMENNAPATVMAQSVTDKIMGVDYRRKWLRVGAEAEDYESNFTRYQALRFFESFSFNLNRVSTLGIDCNQSFYTYDNAQDQSQYQIMAHYNTRLPLAISWYVDAGALAQEISGTEQLQALARTGITWTRGKLSLRTGYEFNVQNTSSGSFTEERVKHFFFTYLRRSF